MSLFQCENNCTCIKLGLFFKRGSTVLVLDPDPLPDPETTTVQAKGSKMEQSGNEAETITNGRPPILISRTGTGWRNGLGMEL